MIDVSDLEKYPLPEPELYQDGKELTLRMEHKGKKASIRLPLHFLKMNQTQQVWYLENVHAVQKLFKQLGIKLTDA